MDSEKFEARIEEVKRRAHGRWTEILLSLGVDEKILNKSLNQPCPICRDGKDRFRYSDKYGEGDYMCHTCGSGGGIKLLQGVLNCRFMELLEKLEKAVGSAAVLPPSQHRKADPTYMLQLAHRIRGEARPIRHGDEADKYFRGRGLGMNQYPRTLLFHPALGYYVTNAKGKSEKVSEHPAVIACIEDKDGKLVTLQRTYLCNGAKLNVSAPKKTLCEGYLGCAVRLYTACAELIVAEGVETAMAAHLLTGKPAWAAIGASNMEKIWIPDTVNRVWIFGDNDANSQFDGQFSAYTLARRLTKERRATKREVEVHVPKKPGTDWADYWVEKQATRQAA